MLSMYKIGILILTAFDAITINGLIMKWLVQKQIRADAPKMIKES